MNVLSKLGGLSGLMSLLNYPYGTMGVKPPLWDTNNNGIIDITKIFPVNKRDLKKVKNDQTTS